MMGYNEVKIWVDVAQFLITGLLAFWLYLDRRNDKTDERIGRLEEQVEQRLDSHSTDIASILTQIKYLPTHQDIGNVHEKVNHVSRVSGRIEGELDVVKRMVEDINTYLR